MGYGLERCFLDVGALLEPAEQRRIARGYATALFGASLGGEDDHRRLLRDHHTGAGWLPSTTYVSLAEHAATQVIADLGADAAGADEAPAAAVRTEGSATAAPVRRPMRTGPSEDLVLQLAWDRGADAPGISVDIEAVDETATHLVLDAVALTPEVARPGTATVQVTDRAGRRAQLPLAGSRPLAELVDGRYLKAGWMHDADVDEPVLQTYRLALADLQAAEPGLDLATLAEVSLRFETDAAGTVLVDDVGFATVAP